MNTSTSLGGGQLSDDTHGWKMSGVFNVESVWCEVLFLKRVKTHLTFGQSHVLSQFKRNTSEPKIEPNHSKAQPFYVSCSYCISVPRVPSSIVLL